jgi:cell division FtsZ-interacting protein ZapD
MEEISLIDFLNQEISFFRELLSSFIAEEMAYKTSRLSSLFEINMLQQNILSELKNKRPKKFKSWDTRNDIDSSLLHNLKDQLDMLITRVNDQLQRNLFLKNNAPLQLPEHKNKKQIIVETLEDEEC